MNQNQSGNALFLILIAVALFAALSYAVTQSGRGGGTIDKEAMLIDAAQLTDYAATVRTAVTRMVLTGTAVANLDFTSSGTGDDAVFDASGGVAWQLAPPSSLDAGALGSWRWVYSTGQDVEDIGTAGANDILMQVVDVEPNACEHINKQLGLSVPVASDPNTGDGWGAYPGKEFACFNGAFSFRIYYHVLVAQ